ncbi:MAG: hypothetical protein Tsb006_2810 [Rickettsiaceae bacterium]
MDTGYTYKQGYLKKNTFKILRYFLFFIFVSFASNKCFAETCEISEVFIEANGNNKHESKIKAHEQGMLRSLYLLASQLNLPTDDIAPIPYHELKQVFRPVVVLNELSLVEKYSATVTYAYDKNKLYKLLLKYGGPQIDNQFYELIILPVFKQGSVLNIWEENKLWLDFWTNYRSVMDNRKIFYPQKNLFYVQKIAPDNLFTLSHEDFISIFRNTLFKNVMIITAEFFTDRKTSNSILQVQRYILRANSAKPEIIEEEYELDTRDDIPHVVDRIINKIIDSYGVLRTYEAPGISEESKLLEEQEIKKPVIMNFDVFDQEELDLVVSKLEKIEQIEHFLVKKDYNTRYKILIYTSADEYELAEALYLNGLSYRIHGNLYNLIDIKKGG